VFPTRATTGSQGSPRLAAVAADTLGTPPPVARAPRRVAGAACALQALALLGFAGFYLYELSIGEGSDATRVAMSAVVILLGAVGLAALARGWFSERGWQRTPTIVWHLLLLPVGVSLLQAGQVLLGWAVLVVALVTFLSALAARQDPDEDDERPASD
jgi:cytochrome bd-type quinol oxidase subunit 1